MPDFFEIPNQTSIVPPPTPSLPSPSVTTGTPSATRPHTTRTPQGQVSTPAFTSIPQAQRTINISEIITNGPHDITVMRNGYPHYGLRDCDLKILESADINVVLSMIQPFVSLTLINDESNDPTSAGGQQDQANTNSAESDLQSPSSTTENASFDNFLFSNQELIDSISNPIGNNEINFLSWGRNNISIKTLSISTQETTGLYSFKNFKFSFVVHNPTALADDTTTIPAKKSIVKSIFDTSKKFLVKWGYNCDVANNDLAPLVNKVLKIIGGKNQETVYFMKWDLGQEDNDQNIELTAEAVPIPNKVFVTVKMGQHVLGTDQLRVQAEYRENLDRFNQQANATSARGTSTPRNQEVLQRSITERLSSTELDGFTRSTNRIPAPNNLIKFGDILDEISSCINWSIEKNQHMRNTTFKFVCGYLNDSLKIDNPNENAYIGNFKLKKVEQFEAMNNEIRKDKNVPHALDYLDKIINKFLTDYSDYSSMSGHLGGILTRKTAAEAKLRGNSGGRAASTDGTSPPTAGTTPPTRTPRTLPNTNTIENATNELQEVDDELRQVMLPNIKFFTHEYKDDLGNTTYYCFLIDSNYGMPQIYSRNPEETIDNQNTTNQVHNETALERVLNSNRNATAESDFSSEDVQFQNFEGQAINSNDMGNRLVRPFDIPIINLFTENTVIKKFKLGSSTDEELQASLIKRTTDAANEQGESPMSTISFNEQFKFLTTNIDVTTFGTSAIQIYQPMFFRHFLKGSIFERLYNVVKLDDEISQGSWQTSLGLVMQAI